MRDTQRETETQAEGEAGSTQAARRRTRSWDPRITTWAGGRCLTAEPPRLPSTFISEFSYLCLLSFSYLILLIFSKNRLLVLWFFLLFLFIVFIAFCLFIYLINLCSTLYYFFPSATFWVAPLTLAPGGIKLWSVDRRREKPRLIYV